MKPESAAGKSSPQSSPQASPSDTDERLISQLLPSQITTRKLLMAMAVVYGVWLLWMGYVAWVNVQAGNQ